MNGITLAIMCIGRFTYVPIGKWAEVPMNKVSEHKNSAVS